jgi:hypothetical protein
VTSNSASDTQAPQTRLGAAFQQLAAGHGELAGILANLMAVVAEEALQNADFGARLNEALVVDRRPKIAVAPTGARTAVVAPAPRDLGAKPRPRRGRRAPGPWDPYDVYGKVGEAGLREALSGLELEQLRDIIAEHGLDPDRRAIKWVTVDKVIGRIVDRVVDRSAKGDAFRGA